MSTVIGGIPQEERRHALAITASNVPEGLLPIITLALAVGVRELARKGVVVKRLSAVETRGSPPSSAWTDGHPDREPDDGHQNLVARHGTRGGRKGRRPSRPRSRGRRSGLHDGPAADRHPGYRRWFSLPRGRHAHWPHRPGSAVHHSVRDSTVGTGESVLFSRRLRALALAVGHGDGTFGPSPVPPQAGRWGMATTRPQAQGAQTDTGSPGAAAQQLRGLPAGLVLGFVPFIFATCSTCRAICTAGSTQPL
jgi:hypothetical protein